MMLPFMRVGARHSQSPMIAEVGAVMEPQWNLGFRRDADGRLDFYIYFCGVGHRQAVHRRAMK